ncbi:MAG: bifunctional demethylmenaquinone methyltransferase/2-methoxy-6-polyprenyl-1,4-benzoquinol methylase UbiE [Deltaproteobacteria bacterium]|nr:bifunctional demethylmenaquinone methyltransferase/2-methoxy-6-polyprenyl-1,4-benzoquinol methylase UbiE [Deltaproteobacteria bacterium]
MADEQPREGEKETRNPPGGSRPTAGETANFGFQKIPAAEKAAWVRDHFDSIARKYDLLNTLLSFGIHYLWKRKAIRLLGLQAGDRVLDVCGGTGDLSVLAVKKVGPSGLVALYDINRKMLATGKSKSTNRAFRKKIAYVQGDAENIAFGPGTFDAALVGFGIRNLTHPEKGFREMYRVLKPGGRFLCLEFSQPTAPLFRRLYDFYSFRLMPLVGLLFVGSRRPFTYLPESIRTFYSPLELSARLREIGFSPVTCRKLTNGIAVIHLGLKDGS